MYKKILVPHAGTPVGDKALKHAVHIAKFDSSEILILHVVEALQKPPTFALSGTESKALAREFQKAAKQSVINSEKEMDKKVEHYKLQNINIRYEVVTGYADEVITRYVKNHDFDLIVMAKRRKLSGIQRLLSLGSVSRKIIEIGLCPVLLIDV
ncbi:MAG TPA: universal stress protein [Nitrosopumilus sp.]|nr:universal stress protein [Thermoproteota archaeon]HJJ22367.1 universal stress protein [Nitrosopumilus sp.]